MKRFASLGLVFFLLASTAFGAQSEYIHQPVVSARVLGMGRAFTALADDYNALYYNPAGLARLEATELNLSVQAGGTPSILSFYSDVKGAGSDPVVINNTLTNYMGSHFASRVGLGGTLVRPSWGLGFYPLDVTVEADIHASGGASIGLQAYQDSLIQFGKSWNLNDQKSFNIGIAPKIVYRGYVEKDLLALDLISANGSILNLSDAQEGMTIDADIGGLYTFDVPETGWLKFLKYARPSLGFAVRNVADEGFANNFHLLGKGSSSINGGSGNMGRRFDVGSRFDLPAFWVFKPRLMIDGQDMGYRYASFKKCLHVGAELSWKAFGWLLGNYDLGYSEGYVTAGVGALLGIFRIDVATYSEEIGTSDSPRESRRIIAKASMDF